MLNTKKQISLLLAITLILFSGVKSDQIACNAHIEISTEDTQVSFDKMSLDVYSVSGSKQESSQCTPDGICFIVVYNLDAFSIRMKGPQGSVFEPAEYKVDTKKGGNCDDLAFKLKGFSLNFAVKALAEKDIVIKGPEGIKVELRKMRNEVVVPTPINTQVTDKDGQLTFNDITLPGTYVLKAIPNENITITDETISCKFEWETGFKCEKEHFLITEYAIIGQVLSYNDPVADVNVYIHQGNKNIQFKTKNYFFKTETNQHGIYRFPKMQPGLYQIVASYSEKQSTFKVQPDVIKAYVNGSQVIVPPFEVIGFSLIGKVVNSKGDGIGAVKIIIDGQHKAVTNDKGLYKLDEITPGNYILEGVGAHYIFDAMNINIQSTSRNLPNLVASDYHLCGRIQINADTKTFSPSKRVVILTDKNKVERRTTTDENGEYCFEVKPSSYVVTPLITAEEKDKGLRLLPTEKSVTVDGVPILNINFSQTKLSISGKVKCLEKEDPSCLTMKVQLLSRGKIVDNVDVNENGQFKFDKILPGKYLLKIQNEEFCWQQERFDIDVAEEDIKDISFVQTGYAMPYESTHTFDAVIKKGKGSSIEKKKITEGKNQKLCFEQRGSYTIIPDPCYKFDSKVFTFETSQTQTAVVFKPSHIKVGGKVQLKDEKDAQSILISVQFVNDTTQPDESTKLKKLDENVYSFEYFSPVDKTLIIIPKVTDESNLIFYPQKKEVAVDDQCITNIIFEAKNGLVIAGKIEPPTTGVSIKVINSKTQQEVITILTDKQGQYKAGPLYDDQQYTVEASKEDYIFKKEENSYNFKAEKLSSLIINVVDANGSPLEAVFIQVSAGKGFRLTGNTNAKGVHKFSGLNSGKLYVTALLKEYEFDQQAMAIDLKDGDHLEKTLTAKRVAFSAFGQVSKLNGQPLEQARIIAKCEDCDRSEETQVDSEGNFRIRGLLPNQKYTVSVVSDIIERTLPHQLTIDVKNQDSKGHQFLALMQSPFVEISGSVNFEGEDEKLIFKEDPKAVVEIFDADNVENPVASWQLSYSRYFQFNTLPRKKYLIRVVPKRGATDKRYEPKIFQANEQGGFHKLEVPKRSSGKAEFNRSAIIGPVIFALIVLGVFYNKQISEWLGLGQQQQVSPTKKEEKPKSNPNKQKKK